MYKNKLSGAGGRELPFNSILSIIFEIPKYFFIESMAKVCVRKIFLPFLR